MEMYMEGQTNAHESLALTAQLEMSGGASATVSSTTTSSSNSNSFRCPFNPVAHDLEPDFRLTRFADLKG